MVKTSSFMLGAFSEEHTRQLTGLPPAQLGQWNREGLVCPEHVSDDEAGHPPCQIYFFKDLLKLRVLSQLQAAHGVSMPELCRVARILDNLSDEDWRTQALWVCRGTVGLEGAGAAQSRDPADGDVAMISLEAVALGVRLDIEILNRRSASQIGAIMSDSEIQSGRPVFSGTRIPVAAILGYINAGYADDAILSSFPDLVLADLAAARKWGREAA